MANFCGYTLYAIVKKVAKNLQKLKFLTRRPLLSSKSTITHPHFVHVKDQVKILPVSENEEAHAGAQYLF